MQVVLKEQFDSDQLHRLVEGMPRRQRRVEVARILRDFSARQQAGLLAFLAEQGTEAQNVKSLWIVNAIYCEATPEVIRRLSERPEVNYVNYDLAYCPDLLEEPETGTGTDEITWGVNKVNAPAVWDLGYTGQGVVCGHIDTGCNYNHSDLADHMWTNSHYPNAGWNFENNNNDPMDVQGHGTHTAGTVAGDGTGGSQTGVAPDAQIMVCRVRTQADSVAESQCWEAMQFTVSPPLAPDSGADLYTMSLGWYISWDPHQAVWRQTADNIRAAGVSQIVAAGNERSISPPNSCRCPGNVPPPWRNPQNTGEGSLSGIVSIGATDVNDSIADFSSRGPVTWASVPPYSDYPYPPGLSRPDVSAPGVDVKSCSRSGGYTSMSGTSMATPHTAGVVCLMLSKNPELTPAEVDSILEVTALDLGPAGKDNDFGAGRIDALAAVQATPFPGPRHDIAIGDIIAPTARIYPERPLTPKVVVENRGDYVETGVLVWCKAESAGAPVYLDTIRVAVMDTLAKDTLVFADWHTGPGGVSYQVSFWHSYVPDTVPQNDTARTTTVTLGHDMATVSMNIDTLVRANRPQTPIVRLENVGGYVESDFLAFCRIDSGAVTIYAESVAVDTVGLGGTVDVSFPTWRVGDDRARYTVRMYHNLAGDQQRTNDTIKRTVVATAGIIRVAIEIADSSVGRARPNACYAIDDLCRAQGWNSRIVNAQALDEWDEIMNYDVVVTGDVGTGDNDFDVYDNNLAKWVRSGGGFVGLGWIVFGIYQGPHYWSGMDSVNAVEARGNYAFQTGGMVQLLDTTHPIAYGVANFNVYDYGEYSVAGLWPGAVMLGNYDANPDKASVAYKFYGEGRSAYLGPIYFADFARHNNAGIFTDPNAMRLLRQAIVWAASGPGAGVVGPDAEGPARARLNWVGPSPLKFGTQISYTLPAPTNVKLAVYDLAGKLVKTLVAGVEPAGVKRVAWDRTDDTGRRVACGIYFCRFEADDASASRKLVVR
ncbi:T9SS type A sorting domain-containing protein [candidate division WOR-3 bacterium]|nr:T9SS type A sorting domain-containing protein [candidate division WOR-3 bacterium]